MASIRNSSSLRPSIEGPSPQEHLDLLRQPFQHAMNMQFSPEESKLGGKRPSKDNCDLSHHGADETMMISSTSKLAGQPVAPFLAKHIPESYAPLGTQLQPTRKDPNTKYCYRHRPDSKCRRTADEPTMENLQRVCLD